MGIERNNRKPKRQRTPAQKAKGRMKTVFLLPEPTAESKPKRTKKVAKED